MLDNFKVVPTEGDGARKPDEAATPGVVPGDVVDAWAVDNVLPPNKVLLMDEDSTREVDDAMAPRYVSPMPVDTGEADGVDNAVSPDDSKVVLACAENDALVKEFLVSFEPTAELSAELTIPAVVLAKEVLDTKTSTAAVLNLVLLVEASGRAVSLPLAEAVSFSLIELS